MVHPQARWPYNYVVNLVTDCWEWQGTKDRDGYGTVTIRQPNNPCGRSFQRAHRLIYETYKPPVPEDRELDHLCRNRGCVNPEHLEPVTDRVNTLRGTSFSAVNAKKTVCVRGHEYTPENTYVWYGRSHPKRACRKCMAIRSAAAEARRRERKRAVR